MALIMPPDVPAIVEPAVAPLIVAQDVALEFKDGGAVWVHILTRHSISDGSEAFRREAIICWTSSDFIRARAWTASILRVPDEMMIHVGKH
jgi:hypothetical protein